MNAYLSDWPHLAQVAQLTRTVTVRRMNKTTGEVVYLITDLAPSAVSPGRLLDLVRSHWSSENSLQYVRYVTEGSDRSQLRSGTAPELMAALRNLVITLIHRQGSDQIAVTRRQFAYHPCRALELLLYNRQT
jgi:predicted transposase YbfD/YdcC